MNGVLKHFKSMDWLIIASSSFLFALGAISIYASSVGGNMSDFFKQMIFFALGISVMIALSFFDWRALKENPYFVLTLYFIGVILLLGLFVFAPEIRDVRRWYALGPISFDPVEFIRIVLIVLLAKYFSGRHAEMYKISHVVLSGIYILIPSVITFFQPDLGSAIILGFLWIGVLIVSGIKTKHFIALCMIGLLVLSLGWLFLLKDYQKVRITAFLEPKMDPQGINWNPEQAKIAIGSGGFLGQGIGKGSQTQNGFLPEAKTDFVFSAIAEELGLLGVIAILGAFSLLFFRILKLALRAPDNFSRLFCSGFVIMLAAQVFVNIGMNQGILPIVGIPLPFVSYGGSSLFFTFIGLGIIQSIKVSIDKF
ncbi:MAG: rod shape-determining protein RodA [Candidatus Nealsonbacteria bacterium]|nr:rod shape-determining protein RodA [Candidatus Nealsonbacteria bacterium]